MNICLYLSRKFESTVPLQHKNLQMERFVRWHTFCQVSACHLHTLFTFYHLLTLGVATVVIQADIGALGTVGIADYSRNIVIGEPVGNYNGTALVR